MALGRDAMRFGQHGAKRLVMVSNAPKFNGEIFG